MKLARFAAVILAGLLVVALVACNGDDEEELVDVGTPTPDGVATPTPGPEATPGPEGTPEPDPEPTPTPEPTTVSVTARDFSFSPEVIEVPAGSATRYEVTNEGMFPHTMTVYWDAEFTDPVLAADTGNIPGGGTETLAMTIDHERTLYFRCEVHPQMQGTIVAQ